MSCLLFCYTFSFFYCFFWTPASKTKNILLVWCLDIVFLDTFWKIHNYADYGRKNPYSMTFLFVKCIYILYFFGNAYRSLVRFLYIVQKAHALWLLCTTFLLIPFKFLTKITVDWTYGCTVFTVCTVFCSTSSTFFIKVYTSVFQNTYLISYWKGNFPVSPPFRPLVGRSVGWSVDLSVLIS